MSAKEYIFSMHHVGKVVPPNNKKILDNINLNFYYGAKIGVLGYNGSGKSTLLKLISLRDKNYNGEITYKKDIQIGYLPQEPELDNDKTVREVVEEGVANTLSLVKEYEALTAKFAEPLDDGAMEQLIARQGDLLNKIEAVQGWDLERTLNMGAMSLNLPPWDAKISYLSGGEKRRVALLRLILANPELLLLDEPTNHLDASSVSWLEKYLHSFPGTVIAVTHDRYFLDNVAGWILELDRGRGIPFEGNYSSWLEQKERRLVHEERQEQAHQRAIKAELEWVRSGAKARQAKSKARLARFEELNSKEFQKRSETQEIYIPPGPRLGDEVITIEHLQKGYGERTLIKDFSCKIPKAAVVGIIGPNGAGKSTFFKMLSTQEKPDQGSITFGSTVQLSYVDQSRDSLNATKTVWEEISDGAETIVVGNYNVPSRAYVGRFNFKGSDQQKIVGDLSGGERNRVHLAKLLKSGGNVILLDEPTNDLDVETLRALEEAILAFPGTVLVISHDRWFLDRVATHILAFEEKKITWFEGNYSEYEASGGKTT